MPSITASRPARTVKVDRLRQIRFNWSAANRFEEAFGKSIPEAMQATVSVRLITLLTWAGMLHEEPGLTLREVERRIQSFINQDGDINDLAMELVKTLAESGVMGKPKPIEDEAPSEDPEGNGPAVQAT